MTPLEAAQATDRAIADIAAAFMLDPSTYVRGAELGYPGASFYFVGRAGALGNVGSGVASAAFVFFNPEAVAKAWADAASAAPPAEAALEFAGCGHAWAEEHMPDDIDLDRLTELCGTIIGGANPAGAPLFAGWRDLPEPSTSKALALHRLNALRELRGALHGSAVLSIGLDPATAVAIKSPFMLPIFGWSEPPDLPPDAVELWERAEEATNAMMAPHLGLLDLDELEQFVELSTSTLAGVS